jgi:hypothetical protein
VRFVVGPAPAPPNQLTTVSVTAGTEPGPLPSLAELERTAADGLRAQFPGLHLTARVTTTLAGRPAMRVQFDAGTSPAVTVDQLAGQTADHRPLTVLVTVHQTRYAPSTRDLQDFLTSITAP